MGDSIGRVESVRGEICTVTGLEGVGLNNVVTFSSGATGIVLGFEHDITQIIMLEEHENVKKGDLVRVTARTPTVTVSDKLLGRVIDPLGRPLDGHGQIDAIGADVLPIEAAARPIYQRALVSRPLVTGYTILDSQIPIGLGQRELLLGEHKTGQVDIAIDIIANQARLGTETLCIYVAIDAEVAVTKRNVERLQKAGALERTVVVFARTASAAPLNYIAPMVGTTIAEWFMARGRDVLIVFDDLTRHAKVYRQLSLLLGRPVSREAYPGDIFYLHSRLLERCGAYNEHANGGTITALPIVETSTEDTTDYITTNLMSITDGHVLFRRALANKGLRPPIDSGFSVSRIGGRVQSKVVRGMSDTLRDILTRFGEIERISAFGADLNEESRQAYNLGLRAQTLLEQATDEPFSPEQQALLLYVIVSKEVLGWGGEQMQQLRGELFAFMARPLYGGLFTTDILTIDEPHALRRFGEFMADFKADPMTLNPTETVPTENEHDAARSALRDSEEVFHAKG